jgi:hypothetical protein
MFSFVLVSFYFVRFLSPRPAKTAWPILTIYTSNDAVLRKEVPFGGSNATKNFQGVHFPQPPNIGPGIGISSLPLATRYYFMLKSLITDTVSDVVECVPKKFARNCKDINTSWPYTASP